MEEVTEGCFDHLGESSEENIACKTTKKTYISSMFATLQIFDYYFTQLYMCYCFPLIQNDLKHKNLTEKLSFGLISTSLSRS